MLNFLFKLSLTRKKLSRKKLLAAFVGKEVELFEIRIKPQLKSNEELRNGASISTCFILKLFLPAQTR